MNDESEMTKNAACAHGRVPHLRAVAAGEGVLRRVAARDESTSNANPLGRAVAAHLGVPRCGTRLTNDELTITTNMRARTTKNAGWTRWAHLTGLRLVTKSDKSKRWADLLGAENWGQVAGHSSRAASRNDEKDAQKSLQARRIGPFPQPFLNKKAQIMTENDSAIWPNRLLLKELRSLGTRIKWVYARVGAFGGSRAVGRPYGRGPTVVGYASVRTPYMLLGCNEARLVIDC